MSLPEEAHMKTEARLQQVRRRRILLAVQGGYHDASFRQLEDSLPTTTTDALIPVAEVVEEASTRKGAQAELKRLHAAGELPTSDYYLGLAYIQVKHANELEAQLKMTASRIKRAVLGIQASIAYLKEFGYTAAHAIASSRRSS